MELTQPFILSEVEKLDSKPERMAGQHPEGWRRPRASAKDKDSPGSWLQQEWGRGERAGREEQGLGAEIEGWRKERAGREKKEELLDFPQLHSTPCH